MKKYTKIILIIILIFTFSAHIGKSIIVHAEADKTQLTAEYNLVTAAIQEQSNSGGTYYETASYAAFLDAVNALGGTTAIQAVIDDVNALQTDVDNLTQSLTTAYNGLILEDTYYATLSNYSSAKALNLTGYTLASITLYNNELDRIKAILDNPTAGENTIQNLNNDINAASSLLVLLGDKTEMNNLVSQINTIYNSDGTAYTPSSYASFQNAYDNIDTTLNNDIGMTLQQAIDDTDLGQPKVDIIVTDLNNILSILVERPDKTELINNYDIADNIDLSNYTSSSSAVFETGLVAIKQVIDDNEALQSDVNQALTDLNNLYNVLVERADVTDLLAAYNEAIQMNKSEYTPNSVAEFNAALATINQVIQSNDTDQQDADQALIDLQSDYNLLILKANKTLLAEKNNEAIVAYYEEKDTYTKDSYNDFKTAVNDYGNYMYVNSVLNDENVSQESVNALETTIEFALLLLVDKADNTNLIKIYDNVKETSLDGYTSSSVIAFNVELTRLYSIITSNNLDQNAAEQALTDLDNVTNILVPLPDFTDLQALVDDAKKYREEDYSTSSYGALQISIGNSEDVINNDDASQQDVDNALLNLENSISALATRETTLYISQGQQIDIKQYVTLGDAKVSSYGSSDPNVISIDGKGIITANSYGTSTIRVLLDNGIEQELYFKVKAGVTTTTIVLSITIPFVGIGVGSTILFTNKKTWINLLKIFKNTIKK